MKGTHVPGQTNKRGYNSFFCYRKRASVVGRDNLMWISVSCSTN